MSGILRPLENAVARADLGASVGTPETVLASRVAYLEKQVEALIAVHEALLFIAGVEDAEDEARRKAYRDILASVKSGALLREAEQITFDSARDHAAAERRRLLQRALGQTP